MDLAINEPKRNFVVGAWLIAVALLWFVLRFDLLPALLAVVASHHAKRGAPNRVLDSDPSHWRVTGLYHGQLIMGGAVPTSRWDAFSLRERR